MKCRKCKNEIKDGEDVFDNDLCESCFLGELLPGSDEQKRTLSKFKRMLNLLNIKEAMILAGEISDKSEEMDRLGKWKIDVENETDLSESERDILISRIIYLNAEVNIRSRE